MSIEATLRTMQNTARSDNPFSATVYTIQKGDTLSKILSSHYKVAPHSNQYKIAEAYALYFNNGISNPNRIMAGTIFA